MPEFGKEKAAIIFTENGVHLEFPEMKDEDTVSPQALMATCVYLLLNEDQDDVNAHLERIRRTLTQ